MGTERRRRRGRERERAREREIERYKEKDKEKNKDISKEKNQDKNKEKETQSPNHLSVHPWVRSAIHASQQLTSPIGFLSLKLPPPPCAVLLVHHIQKQLWEAR